MKAVQYIKSVPRFLFVRAIGHRRSSWATGSLSCIGMRDVDPPPLPTREWFRVKPRLSGICGSDLSTVLAKGSPYFSPLISSPFVLGHEIVGDIIECGSIRHGFSEGDRVVIEPALCCPVRGVHPFCTSCAKGDFGLCDRVMHGDISQGVQTGYCRDTGGGWSSSLVAHPFQLHPIPDQLSDVEAVLVEPLSCCAHAALSSMPKNTDTVLILGCGTVGLLTIAALRLLGSTCRILAAARYPHQQKLAKTLGADLAIGRGDDLYEKVSEITGAEVHQPEIGRPVFIGGVDRTFDCVGSERTLDDAMRLTGSGGSVAVVGMPGIPKGIDWTAIWYKELNVKGVYGYGTEHYEGQSIRTFDLAIRLMLAGQTDLKPLVTDLFALKDYRKAVGRAITAGPSGAVKVAFDMRNAPA